jgi:hypothetical protein
MMKIEKVGENAVKITGVEGAKVVNENLTPEQLLGILLKHVASPKYAASPADACAVCAGN